MQHADLRAAVEASGLSVRALAHALNMKKSSVQNVKVGKGWALSDGRLKPEREAEARKILLELERIIETTPAIKIELKPTQTIDIPSLDTTLPGVVLDTDTSAQENSISAVSKITDLSTGYIGLSVLALLEATEKLLTVDLAQAREHCARIMRAAIESGVRYKSGDAALIQKAIAKVLYGEKLTPVREDWKAEEKRFDLETAATNQEKENARIAAEAKVELEAEGARAEEAAELWPKIKKLATDPRIIERLVEFVGARGVVGENPARIAIFLTVTSRLHKRKAISLLRRGAASSGKNYLVEAIIQMVSPESLIVTSGGSPKSLPYRGGKDDTNALKHKVIYIPEAAAIASKHGVENDNTLMLRTLISEGRLVYQTVITRNEQEPVTVEIIKNGPIALILTSARDNIEDELLTRLMLADSDESATQTAGVLASTFKRAAGGGRSRKCDTTLEDWQNYQRWLEVSGAPYEVAIPFAESILAAYEVIPRPLRARRDAESILTAVAASAIAHKAQRETDSDGRIIAELSDYTAAYLAFSGGLSAVYAPQASVTVLALVRALEEMLAEAQKAVAAALSEWKKTHSSKEPVPLDLQIPDTVEATYKQIEKKLGITSGDVVGPRLQAARAAKLIEITNAEAPRSVPRRYKILISSKDAQANADSVVMPSPSDVETMLNDKSRREAGLDRLAKVATQTTLEDEEPQAISDPEEGQDSPFHRS